MDRGEIISRQLDEIRQELGSIGRNLLYVYWIVAIFACLYFGLMIYLLFIR
jgi:hypothetical protein